MAEEKLSAPERRFAAQVKKLREQKGWSQAELAERMAAESGLEYVNPSTISRIEAASRPVRMVEAQALSRLFDMTVEGMMHPDGREVFVSLFELNHRQRRMAYAKFRELAREVAEGQVSNADEMRQLVQMFPSPDQADPHVRSKYEHLLRNMQQFDEIDLLGEAAEMINAVAHVDPKRL